MKHDDTLTDDLIKVGLFSTKLLWETSKFLVKNTPKAIVAVADAKRELVDTIESELCKIKKIQKEELLDNKIANLKAKSQRKK